MVCKLLTNETKRFAILRKIAKYPITSGQEECGNLLGHWVSVNIKSLAQTKYLQAPKSMVKPGHFTM